MKKRKITTRRNPPAKKPKGRKKPSGGKRPRWVLMVVTVVVVAGGIGLTTWWRANAVSEGIEVIGAQHAVADELITLANADSGSVFYGIDLQLVQDRVERHPWIGEARALRGANLILNIKVTERTPALLVIDPNGRPSHYLDAEGYQMPYVTGAAYDVPLLRGFTEDYNPVNPIEDPTVLELLHEITQLPPEIDVLLSTFHYRSNGIMELDTTPAPGRGAIRVTLGPSGFNERFERLQAFWRQRILPERDVRFEAVDLRYSSQIITREAPVGQ